MLDEIAQGESQKGCLSSVPTAARRLKQWVAAAIRAAKEANGIGGFTGVPYSANWHVMV